MTNKPVYEIAGVPFPVLVIAGDTPHIELRDSPKSFPIPPGSSFLVPPGRESSVEDDLNAHHATPTAITMRYRKVTGPGFGMIASLIATLINAVAWSIAIFSIRMYRGYRRTLKP